MHFWRIISLTGPLVVAATVTVALAQGGVEGSAVGSGGGLNAGGIGAGSGSSANPRGVPGDEDVRDRGAGTGDVGGSATAPDTTGSARSKGSQAGGAMQPGRDMPSASSGETEGSESSSDEENTDRTQAAHPGMHEQKGGSPGSASGTLQ